MCKETEVYRSTEAPKEELDFDTALGELVGLKSAMLPCTCQRPILRLKGGCHRSLPRLREISSRLLVQPTLVTELAASSMFLEFLAALAAKKGIEFLDSALITSNLVSFWDHMQSLGYRI